MSFKELLAADQKRYYSRIITISKKQRELRDKKQKSLVGKLSYLYYTRKRNKVAPKRNIWLQGKIGKNPKLFHGNVIVNQYAVVGDNVIFHGNNCIGNNGKNELSCPVIGDNVEFGYGACVFGDVFVANNTVIAAGAIVVKDIVEENSIVGGIPAKIIKRGK